MTDSFDAAILTRFIADAMDAVGMPASDAADVGRLMVASDLAGFDGHGIFRLESYLGRITAGGLNLTPKIAIATQSPATAVVDGDDGMGHLVVEYATHLALDKARQNGIGWVGTRNSNHAGAASVYATMPAEHGMIGLYGAVGSGNNLPPWGGLDPKLATNPIAVAIPSADGAPVVIDFATTVTSMGKIKTTAQRGEQMPEGWMIAKDGTPMTDPSRASEGLLLPIGGYKGYALGLVIGLLAGTLNGASMGDAVVDMTGKPGEITNTGQFICAIDPGVFGDAGAIASQVARVADEMRASAVMPGHDGVRVPGDGRAARMTERGRNGVPIPDGLRTVLDRLAGDLSIDPLTARTI